MYTIKAEDLSRTEAERLRDYRRRMGDKGRQRNATRMRKSRAAALPEFIGVDGEGVGKGKNHRYVLLGVGDEQYENPDGIHWEEAFRFLYDQFRKHPRATFVGFYLSYDFNKILATLPHHAAKMLLTKQGKAARRIPEYRGKRTQYYPVRESGWEIDMLGFKRLSIRPRPDGCECYESKIKCTHKQLPWMYICDAGPFYQMGFVKVLDPSRWKDDPDGPVCTQEQYKRIVTGKDRRSYARLDGDMRAYNVEENLLLAAVMTRLAKGFYSVGIRPSKNQWYGPGATASQWLGKHDTVKRKQLRMKDGKKPALMPKWFWDACSASYFGGWFEIFSHGIIHGTSYNYDINNAYPYAATKLPHICRECRYIRESGTYRGRSEYVLLYCTVYSKGTRIGSMPYRNKQGNILRPTITKGWYWRFEIEAARRAGLVKRVVTHEWAEFVPCDHPNPFKEIYDLYYLRLKVGKDSAQGMAIKLNNNSIYGKFAQSVGAAPYNNWFYASYITAHCRAQILDAIATHPDKASAVLMVATDGICFDSPNPALPISKQLGEWAHTEYDELCLFKPGVYWHREGREALLKVKSRGVPRDEFIKAIDKVQAEFQYFIDDHAAPGWDFSDWLEESLGKHYGRRGDGDENAHRKRMIEYDYNGHWWPRFVIHVNFRMKSCLQALNEGNWSSAAEVQEKFPLWQDSNPSNKRDIGVGGTYWNDAKKRIDSTIHTLPADEIQTYYHKDIERTKSKPMGFGLEGDAIGPILEAAGILRDKPANYNLPVEEYEWERVW
jgi:hypothetical protein